MGRLPHVPGNQKDHQMEHMIERSLRARGREMHSQLHHHPGASVREKSKIGGMTVSVKTVLNAVQGHELVICLGHNHSQRSHFPSMKTDAKIRRTTESSAQNVECAKQSASTSARLPERIRKRPRGSLFRKSNSIQDGTRFENCVFLARETSRTPSISILRDPEVASTLLGSPRDSLRASDITSSSELEHSKPASGAMERSARDLARMDLELLLNLVRSETRPTSEASSRHPSRTANAKPFSDASVQMQTSSQRRPHKIPPNALCNTRTVDRCSPETNYDARANLTLASRVERAPRLPSAH